jgi:hypothetical protein
MTKTHFDDYFGNVCVPELPFHMTEACLPDGLGLGGIGFTAFDGSHAAAVLDLKCGSVPVW